MPQCNTAQLQKTCVSFCFRPFSTSLKVDGAGEIPNVTGPKNTSYFTERANCWKVHYYEYFCWIWVFCQIVVFLGHFIGHFVAEQIVVFCIICLVSCPICLCSI